MSTKNTLDGCKVEYRCSAGKYRVKNVLLDCVAEEGVSFICNGESINMYDDSTDSIRRGLSYEIKRFIKENLMI